MLRERRREIRDEVRTRMRDGRSARPSAVGDLLELSDGAVQGEIDLALLQMKAGLLGRIDEALRRLDTGDYGVCADCGGEIAERRLRAVLFAVRCQACERRQEEDSSITGAGVPWPQLPMSPHGADPA